MKQKKKSLFSLLLALMMVAGLMQGMTVETKAATNSVQAGPFTLSRDSGAIVEGVDYTYGQYKYGSRNSLTILTGDITIAMDENAEPTSDIIELGEFNKPPFDSFSKVTFSNLKLKSYSDNVLSYVDNIHITLVGSNELVSIKEESRTYGNFAIFGYGSVSIENSPNGSLYATGDGLGWGALLSSSSYGKSDACITVGDAMSMKSSTAMMADISELTDTPKTWTNCIAVNNNEDYRTRGFAKTLLIGMWKHSHTWSYAVDEGKDGSRILAACSGLGDCDEKDASLWLSLSAENTDYDGTAKAANITTSEDWKRLNLPVPEIVYYLSGTDTKTNSDNSGAEAVGGAPKLPGSYKAQITVGTDTKATKEFTITCKHGEWVETVSDSYLKTAATCTAPAVYYKSCKLCGAKGTETFTSGNPLGHDFSNNAEACRREGCNEKNPDYKPATPVIIEGAGGEWTKESGATLRFRSDAGISSFLRVEVDGTVVDAKNYTVTEGSTIVTFTAEYLESLATGKHTVAIVSSISGEEKKATAEFTVAKKADTTNGSNNATADQTTAQKTKVLKTGDESPVGYLLALLALCGAAVVFTGKKGYLK
ncbi:MAG: hypothetical protein ACLSHE_02350 [Roseburia sp.]